MSRADEILAFTDAVAEQFKPARIVLFGSHAYGRPNRDSDVDVLIVMNYRGPGHRHATRIRHRVRAPFPLDLIVRSAAEIERRVAWNDFFLKEATEKGLVLYAADDPRVGAEGRKKTTTSSPSCCGRVSAAGTAPSVFMPSSAPRSI